MGGNIFGGGISALDKLEATQNGRWYDYLINGQSAPSKGVWFKEEFSGTSTQSNTAGALNIHGNLPDEKVQATLGTPDQIYYESTNAFDTNSAGVGANTIQAIEIDSNWNPVLNDVELDGTTSILGGTGYGANNLVVKTAGALGGNAGDIYATVGGAGQGTRNIFTQAGEAHNCFFMMPARFEGVATDFVIEAEQIALTNEYAFSVLDPATPLTIRNPQINVAAATDVQVRDWTNVSIPIPAKRITYFLVKVGGATNITVSYKIYLRYVG